MSELSGREFLLAQLAPSDLLGICLGLIGAALVLGGAYYATILINKAPRPRAVSKTDRDLPPAILSAAFT